MFAGSAFHVLTTRYQKVLAIKAVGHNGLQSLNWCPRATEESASLKNMLQSNRYQLVHAAFYNK